LIICIGFALGIYLWPSLVKVLEVLIHPPLLGGTRFLQLVPMGEKVKRALKSLRFWRLMPKGEKY
jgi:hypothetical protein